MNGCQWIVCEQSSRWAAALRLELERDVILGGREFKLREVRSLAELSEVLAERPAGLAAIEVRQANLGDVLIWLSDATRSGSARCVALMDRSLKPSPWEVAAAGSGPLDDAGDALREAGAIDVVFSPRHLGPLIELGRRHAASVSRWPVVTDIELSFTARAWASLPWQAR